jgi:hypothetical protein
MTSSESDEQPPSRKRSRTSNTVEDGAKKARGRPRVDTQDATAADVSGLVLRLCCTAAKDCSCIDCVRDDPCKSSCCCRLLLLFPSSEGGRLTTTQRRRTQIRLAQRAYRQRKETTISSLVDQSTHLHSIIEQMHKTLMSFNESALKSGLGQFSPALAKELQHATETSTSLAKAASESKGSDDEQGESAEQPIQTAPRPQVKAQ